MTTLDSQADKSLCHLDKVPSTELAEVPFDCGLHGGITTLESQVSGHSIDEKRRTIGKHPIKLNASGWAHWKSISMERSHVL